MESFPDDKIPVKSATLKRMYDGEEYTFKFEEAEDGGFNGECLTEGYAGIYVYGKTLSECMGHLKKEIRRVNDTGFK